MTTIIVFGLSGAGKSTLADLLGQRLNLRVVHPSSLLRQLLQGQPVDLQRSAAGQGFWESVEGERLFRDRLAHERPADLACDQLLLREIARGQLVMDSWTMPWLSTVGTKVHLTAPLAVRARRVATRGGIPLERATAMVELKDEQTRQLNLRHYGFDILHDHGVFDLTLDVTRRTPEQALDALVAAIT